MSNWQSISVVAALAVMAGCLMAGCRGCDGPEHDDRAEVATDIYAPMGEPMASATDAQRQAFERGRQIARRRFTPASGLGPSFNVTSCTSCHEQPVTGGASPRYRNFYITGARLSDGSQVLLGKSGVQNQLSTTPPRRVPTDDAATFIATRNTIPFFGVGALAEVPESSILEHADPDDQDGDGISGRPNYDRGYVGRFGRKAQTVSIEGFVRGPIFNHAGITSNPLPNQRKAELPVPSDRDLGGVGARSVSVDAGLGVGFCPTCQSAAPEEPLVDDDEVADPELGEDALFDLVSFTMLLGAPKPDALTDDGLTDDGWTDEALTDGAEQGKALFEQVGCTGCHVPGLEGPRGLVMAYTDLLLHDMGPGLADGLKQGVATGQEFRTQPLWGVAATAPYLHDGRADTLDQAISMHGGEAAGVRDDYEALGDHERQAIVEFLESLGGRARRSDGLLAPDKPVAEPGSYGGPREALDDQMAARYEQGRAVFDRDVTLDAGLGPKFNGDSCRACHFEPTIGGAGPAGLDVTRQGVVDPDSGSFFAPEGGTMVHRLGTALDARPAAHPDANVFELRQPPPLYGLGQVDRIADAQIEANADPDDDDQDAISGRLARLDDGSIGRFGWKAQFGSLEDFVRDALSTENGVTVPAEPSFAAGVSTDGDGVQDPEITTDDYEALVFYSSMLGPPPADTTLDERERDGRQQFDQVGCDGCHVPQLETVAGEPVRLYSDLLLHDVAPDDYRGVAGGAATMREFRTPPIWGIADSGPYMHDGLSADLDAAIHRHAGEAAPVVARYEQLTDRQRQNLVLFLEAL